MHTKEDPELTAEQAEEREYVRDLLSHPGWALFEQQCKFEMQSANARRRSTLVNPTVDGVALLAVNCEARIDAIQQLIFATYKKAGIVDRRPAFTKLGGFGDDGADANG